jgi:hypothetical protein
MRDQRERRRAGRRLPRCCGSSTSGSASAALARTTGVALSGRLRRFGVLLALLGGHLPHDERSGGHLAIEVALSLLLALLLAFLWCRHRSSLLVSQSNDTPRLSVYPRVRSLGSPPLAGAWRPCGSPPPARAPCPDHPCRLLRSWNAYRGASHLRAPGGKPASERPRRHAGSSQIPSSRTARRLTEHAARRRRRRASDAPLAGRSRDRIC